jgi:AdoMet-dependent heme synthase
MPDSPQEKLFGPPDAEPHNWAEDYSDQCDDPNYYIHRVNSNKFLIINAARQKPIMVNAAGKAYVHLLLEHGSCEACLKHIPAERQDNFREFYQSIVTIGLLDHTPLDLDLPKALPRGPTTNTIQCYLHLTSRCNLSCKYCYNAHNREDREELSLDDLRRVLDKVLPHARALILTGGEPLLSPHAESIIRQIREQKQDVLLKVLTNGMLDFAKIGVGLFEPLDEVTISCDRMADDPVRQGFSIARFHRNVDWMTRHGFKDRLSIASVLTSENIEAVKQVVAFCRQSGILHKCTLITPVFRRHREVSPEAAALADIDPALMAAFEHEMYCPQRPLADDEPFDAETVPVFRHRCGAGIMVLSIDADGTCYPCQSLHYPEFAMGNIVQNSLDEILGGEISMHLFDRGFVENKEGCRTCKLKYFCGGGCMALVYGMKGRLDAFPGELCEYNKISTLNSLAKGVFYSAHREREIATQIALHGAEPTDSVHRGR